MKVMLVIVALLLGHHNAGAQDTIGIKQLVARFEVKLVEGNKEAGTGFIVAKQGDTLYLVTAGHVLRKRLSDTSVNVTLGNREDTLQARVRLVRDPQKGDKEDLALCTVLSKDYQYDKIPLLDTLSTGIPVFYYHNRDLCAVVGDNEQLLITWNNEKHTYRVYMPGVEGGDSGGPVFTNRHDTRLSGIIISGDQSCEILRISHILAIIRKELPNLNLN